MGKIYSKHLKLDFSMSHSDERSRSEEISPAVNMDSLMTRFQLILPVHSHNVSKNLTGHRINVEGPLIYQINRQTNSFQIMCDMLLKIDRLVTWAT